MGFWLTSCSPPNRKHNIQNMLTRLSDISFCHITNAVFFLPFALHSVCEKANISLMRSQACPLMAFSFAKREFPGMWWYRVPHQLTRIFTSQHVFISFMWLFCLPDSTALTINMTVAWRKLRLWELSVKKYASPWISRILRRSYANFSGRIFI